jgi:hypothetical protein
MNKANFRELSLLHAAVAVTPSLKKKTCSTMVLAQLSGWLVNFAYVEG